MDFSGCLVPSDLETIAASTPCPLLYVGSTPASCARYSPELQRSACRHGLSAGATNSVNCVGRSLRISRPVMTIGTASAAVARFDMEGYAPTEVPLMHELSICNAIAS